MVIIVALLLAAVSSQYVNAYTIRNANGDLQYSLILYGYGNALNKSPELLSEASEPETTTIVTTDLLQSTTIATSTNSASTPATIANKEVSPTPSQATKVKPKPKRKRSRHERKRDKSKPSQESKPAKEGMDNELSLK